LIVSSDSPAVAGKQIDWLIDTCMETQEDLYYGVCPREVMEKRFPASKRTYTKLKDIELCSADMHVSHVRMATEHLDMWENLIGNRKTPLNQAAIIGLDVFTQVLTHSITLNDLAAKVAKRLGITGRAIVWEEAEPCMDVDKPHQFEILRADLAKQIRRAASGSKAAKAKPVRKPAAKPSPSSRKTGAKAGIKSKPKVKK
jgi:hypothetical protein